MERQKIEDFIFLTKDATDFLKEQPQQELAAKLREITFDRTALLSMIHCEEQHYPEFMEIADVWQQKADALLVLGVGGSQAGTKAVIEALQPKAMQVYFAGHGFSSHYLQGILDRLTGKSVVVVVVSKSGNTTETLVTFGIIRNWLQATYGADYAKRVLVVTGKKQNGGVLGNLADESGYRRFYVPDQIGGRYAMFTAVGLLPMAIAGVDIRQFLQGALAGEKAYAQQMDLTNPAVAYGYLRNALYRSGYTNELWVTYAPYLVDFGTWWRQLFVESESKHGMGIYPVVAEYSNDLHYLGQYLRQGPRNIFETVLWLEKPPATLALDEDMAMLLGLPQGEDLTAIANMVKEETRQAHKAAGVPQLSLTIPCLDPWQLGKLVVFFVQACLASSFLQGCNPFDQPGVEAYKEQISAALKSES